MAMTLGIGCACMAVLLPGCGMWLYSCLRVKRQHKHWSQRRLQNCWLYALLSGLQANCCSCCHGSMDVSGTSLPRLYMFRVIAMPRWAAKSFHVLSSRHCLSASRAAASWVLQHHSKPSRALATLQLQLVHDRQAEVGVAGCLSLVAARTSPCPPCSWRSPAAPQTLARGAVDLAADIPTAACRWSTLPSGSARQPWACRTCARPPAPFVPGASSFSGRFGTR